MPRAIPALATAFAATALLVGASLPAGAPSPTIIRTATIDGVRGPVYYSVVDGRYRAVTRPERKVAELAQE